jgi:pyruvate dehydrogenase E1 component alpha subunit/2-oxoisovalerate dehydrogenase E1 component alpha subunit
MRDDGSVDPSVDPGLDRELLLRIYEHMLLLRQFDERMLLLQRQGRVGFHGPSKGQEAATIASCAALAERDWIFPALREAGAALYRGLPLEQMVCQCIGNAGEVTKGRQMPCHHSYRAGHFVAMSSVIGTQLPHAVGAAMAARIRGDDAVVMGYLGDGATSTPEFHAAMNFAAVFRAPCVLVCQNNQWAISVPFKKQTNSRTIAQKALAYGFQGIQVDGNDVLAVYAASRDAVEKARAGQGPTLIECVTYRLGVHTTADDPTKYRSDEEVKAWEQKDPLTRFRAYLEKKQLLDGSVEEQVDEEIARAVKRFEAMPPADPLGMFDHAYAELPPGVATQRAELAGRLEVKADAAAPAGAEPVSPPMRGQRRTSRWQN